MTLHKNLALRDAQRRATRTLLEKIELSKSDTSDTSLLEFSTILEKLEGKSQKLESLNEKIIGQTDPENYEEEITTTEEFTLDLEIQLRRLRLYRDQRCTETPTQLAVLERIPEAPEDRPLPASSTHIPPEETQRNEDGMNFNAQTVSNLSFNSAHSSQFHRLPKLELPTFDGDILTWQTFWDSFEATVHLNINLTDVQRFSYLKAQLVSDAARTIEGFALTNANYARALELLKSRYGQQHKIIHATMQALLQISPPTSSLHSLRHFHDKMETYIRGLESIGHFQDTYGSLLVPIVLDKLPADIRRNLARCHGNSSWQLDDLRNAIDREIDILEAGECTCIGQPEVSRHTTASFLTDTKPNHTNQTRPFQSQLRPSHAHTRSEEAHTSSQRPEPKCAFCDLQHFSTGCQKFPDAASRKDIVIRRKLCFNCLGKHRVANCSSRRRCKKCSKKHHTSICQSNPAPQQSASAPTPQSQQPGTAVFHSSTSQNPNAVLLKTALAPVCSETLSTDAFILLDEGSHRSFITDELATTLQLTRSGTETISLTTFGGSSAAAHLATATVYVMTETRQKIPLNVLIVPTIAQAVTNYNKPGLETLPHLQGLKLANPVSDSDTVTISLLIGADHYWDIVEDQVIRGNGPTAVKSRLGYLLSGPISDTPTHSNQVSSFNVITSLRPVDHDLERFWDLESIGIQSPESSDKTPTLDFQDYQNSCISFDNGRYVAAFPWKQDHQPLPSNYSITHGRTLNTIRRLSKEPGMLQQYSNIIKEQERRGFIEKVPHAIKEKGHYIPHHPVRKESSTTPLRIVYDCSCKQSRDQSSLNDCLKSTPPVLNDITTLLVRFRLHKYAVTTDIEKAFLHVGLHQKDRDFTRFLWLSDPSDPDSALETYRFKVVLFGATCSPFMLNATILKHLQLNRHIFAAGVLERDLYVDNVVSGFDNESELLTYYSQSRTLMSSAGMNLRSWASNSSTLRSVATDDNVVDADDVTKVLGLHWNSITDILTFAQRDIPIVGHVTKRHILSMSSKIFDPLGLLGPVTVRAKLMIQDLWRREVAWDTPLSDELQDTWGNLSRDINMVTKVEFGRQLIHSQHENQVYMHVFVDASPQSYGAAVYVCNNTESSLVMARNRVAPLKALTLPQLELMAALIGARLATHLQPALKTTHTTYWSDSQIVLHWLSTSKPLKRFVANRVKEIRALSDVSSWFYCPTRDNPADLVTRGVSAKQFLENDLWFKGPSWLCYRHNWPIWEGNSVVMQVIADESTSGTSTVTSTTTTTHRQPSTSSLFNFSRYSQYTRLLRVTAYTIRFTVNCRKQRSERDTGPLTARELELAEKVVIRQCQSFEFPEVITELKQQRKSSPLIKQLRLFLDPDNLIRCGGRINNAPIECDAKFPLLLPKKSPLTTLIVQDAHHRSKHSGVNSTATLLRQKYWVPAIRQCIQAVTRKCVSCRKVQGRPYTAPDPAPLPKVRLTEAPPFTITGIDFTGALYVRHPDRREQKVYICLFTCANTRAVHLEVVESLSEESFINAFRRFSGRKSLPKTVISDNATTFHAASSHLKHIFQSESVRSTFSDMGVVWQFIPKRAPWYGGFWERLIGITKSTLKKCLGRAYVSLDTLHTMVTEIEALINDRPLTFVSANFDDDEPLTPSHLLHGRRLTSLPHGNVLATGTATSIRADLQSRAKKLRHIIEHYWSRWRSEYLTSLREYHRKSGKSPQTISPGDVVLVHDEANRSSWKLAIIEETLPGRDGLVRAARIRTQSGLRTTRPIVKLYPLEVHNDN